MPFDPDKYLQEKTSPSPSSVGGNFDPDKYLAQKTGAAPAAPAPESDKTGAAIEGFGQGVSMGYLPQLQAAAYKGAQAVADALGVGDKTDELLKKQGFKINQGDDSFVGLRDENIKRNDALAKSNPYVYRGAQVAGGIDGAIAASPLLPARAATIGGRIMQAAKIGGAMGAVANPGDQAGVIDTTGQLPDRAINAAKGAALATILGAAVETPAMAKSVAGSVRDVISNSLGKNVDFTPIANQAEVQTAAKNLGINELPKGVLTDNPTYQKLESGLSQSGSLPAKSIRDQYSNLSKGLDTASSKIDAIKTPDSDFGIGSKIQQELADRVKANSAPVSELYNDINPLLKKIPVDKGVVNSQFGALKRNPLFQTKDGAALLDDQKSAISGIDELGSLKEFRSTLRESIGNNSTPLDAKRVNAIYDAVTKIRDNSIVATKDTLPADLHGEVDAFTNQIALADSAHRSNIDDINSIRRLVGNKDFSSPTEFLNKLGEMKESDLAQKASSLDVGTWKNLQDKFPSVFEKAKTAKLNDMVQNSTNPISGFSDVRFLKQYEGLDKELKDIIFDPKMQEHIDSLQTLRQAIPPKLGPSGTPEGTMIMQMIDPKRNLMDYGIKKTLENASAGASVSPAAAASNSSGSAAKIAAVSGGTRAPFVRTDRAPVSTPAKDIGADAAPAKGETKWANDGFQNLVEHGRDPASLDSMKDALMADPAGRQLLINASDLKPGSAAMDKILERIKRDYGVNSSRR